MIQKLSEWCLIGLKYFNLKMQIELCRMHVIILRIMNSFPVRHFFKASYMALYISVCVTRIYLSYSGSNKSLNTSAYQSLSTTTPFAFNDLSPLKIWMCGQDFPPYFMFNMSLTKKLVPEQFRNFAGTGRWPKVPDCPRSSTDIVPSTIPFSKSGSSAIMASFITLVPVLILQ